MKRRGLASLATVAVLVATGGLVYLFREDSGVEKSTLAGLRLPDAPAGAMVPWRDPEKDMAALFPGAAVPDAASPRIVALSRRRAEILKRLGPETPLDSNALYLFPVPGKGVVLVRRAAGEYGAIEVVLGVDTAGRAVGVRLQRHREPPEIASALTSPTFLLAFRGKTARDDFALGEGLPAVPAAARRSATALARAVRALLIEYDAGTRP